MNIHLPAILGFTFGTRVLTHPQMNPCWLVNPQFWWNPAQHLQVARSFSLSSCSTSRTTWNVTTTTEIAPARWVPWCLKTGCGVWGAGLGLGDWWWIFKKNDMGLSENRVYSQWNSHLIGIMIINHWVQWGTQHFQTHPYGSVHISCWTVERCRERFFYYTSVASPASL